MNDAVAEWLNKYKHHKKFSDSKLAEMIGTYRGTINRIARGTQVPSFETLQNLHLNTDLDIIWLLTGNPMGEWDLLRHGG